MTGLLHVLRGTSSRLGAVTSVPRFRSRPTHRADDVYFSLRDAPRDVQQGDFVYYLEVEGAKGPAARELNHLPFHEQTVRRIGNKAEHWA